MNTLAPVNRPIIVGKISGVFGIHGWLKIFSYSDPRDNILSYDPWMVKQNSAWQSFDLLNGRKQGKTIVAQLKGIDSPDKAATLMGSRIAIEPLQLKKLSEGEYYWRDLLGLEVITPQGQLIGYVSSLLATGANDVLVVQRKSESSQAEKLEEVLIPYIEEVIIDIRLDQGVIEVNWEENAD